MSEKSLKQMTAVEVLREIGVYLSIDAIYECLYDRTTVFPVEVQEKILADTNELFRFFIKNNDLIDKTKLAMVLAGQCKIELAKKTTTGEIRTVVEDSLKTARKLLKGTDEQIAFIVRDPNSEPDYILFVDSKEEAEGKPRKIKAKNEERLKKLEQQIDLRNIVQAISPEDIESVIPFTPEIGTKIRFLAMYRTLKNELRYTRKQIDACTAEQFDEISHSETFCRCNDEKANVIRQNIKGINFDRMLLCASMRMIEGVELGTIPPEKYEIALRNLMIMRNNLSASATLPLVTCDNEYVQFTTKDLEDSIKSFIPEGNKIKYLTKDMKAKIKRSIENGEISFNDVSQDIFEALNIPTATLNSICAPSKGYVIQWVEIPSGQGLTNHQ